MRKNLPILNMLRNYGASIYGLTNLYVRNVRVNDGLFKSVIMLNTTLRRGCKPPPYYLVLIVKGFKG